MKCFFCNKEACAKAGSAQGNIWSALLPSSLMNAPSQKSTWSKSEKYLCRKHFEELVK